MIDLTVGMRLFHNGVPVELLYRVEAFCVCGSSQQHELWKVRPLFVSEEDHEQTFSPNDRITFLHTREPAGLAPVVSECQMISTSTVRSIR